MKNSQYDSLTDKLIKSGIIKNEFSDEQENIENLYGIVPAEDMSNSPFICHPVENEKVLHKRINNYDFNLLENAAKQSPMDNSAFKLIKRFLNFKENKAQKSNFINIEKFLFTFFPKLYKAKLVKDAMVKLRELNIDAKVLLDKTIPYGESESRYQNLIEYLKYANELQVKLKKKI